MGHKADCKDSSELFIDDSNGKDYCMNCLAEISDSEDQFLKQENFLKPDFLFNGLDSKDLLLINKDLLFNVKSLIENILAEADLLTEIDNFVVENGELLLLTKHFLTWNRLIVVIKKSIDTSRVESVGGSK